MSGSGPTPSREKRAEQFQRLAWLEAQAPLGWAIILVLAALLGTVYLNQASRTATVGRHVQVLQAQLDELKRNNAALERDIAGAQSLERLRSEALRLGFRPAETEDVEYLIVPDYPVLVEATPAPTVIPLVKPIESVHEALWLTVTANVKNLVRGESGEQ